MNKMREAFDEWFGQDGGSVGNPIRYQTFKAGYQAAIAAVKEGGAGAWLYRQADGDWKLAHAQAGVLRAIPLYRIPEDTP